MDADRRDSEMTDAALDRELQSILAVDPSPAFDARVRARIASEPRRSTSWTPAWIFAGAAAAAAIVAIAVLAPGRVPPDRAPALSPIASRPLTSIGSLAFGAPRAARSQPARHTTDEMLAPSIATAERLSNEVVVDPREAAAILALLARARDGRIDLAPALNASTPAVMDSAPMADITIPDITIDPIAPAPGAEGVRQ